MKVFYKNSQKVLRIDRDQVKSLVRAFLHWKRVRCEEVGVYFVNKVTITELHNLYFQDPTPTDCISFPMDLLEEGDAKYRVLGELFICPEVACEYAKENDLSSWQELSLYIVHGLLHLLGYSDCDPLDISVMRKEENLAMRYLHSKGKLLYETILTKSSC